MTKLWFRRKRWGWGWTPNTWQGWAVTLAYVTGIVACALTVDDHSTPRELAFTFFLPLILLTTSFIRIGYAKGEKPRWQWGDKGE
jgi:hypothetical protein